MRIDLVLLLAVSVIVPTTFAQERVALPYQRVERVYRLPETEMRGFHQQYVANRGRYFAVYGNGKLRLWDMATNKIIYDRDAPNWGNSVSTDGRTIYSGRVFRLSEREWFSIYLMPRELTWSSTHLSPGGADNAPYFRVTGEASLMYQKGAASLDDLARLGGRGFGTFDEAKAVLGQAGPNMAWHHIVTQHPNNIATFGNQMIHNTANLMALPNDVHIKLHQFLNSPRPNITGSPTQTVAAWLRTQDYSTQFKRGADWAWDAITGKLPN